jgi:hypothetical protein
LGRSGVLFTEAAAPMTAPCPVSLSGLSVVAATVDSSPRGGDP